MHVRSKEPADQAWVEHVLRRAWGGLDVAVHGRRFDTAQLPALIAGDGGGLLTYETTATSAEIVTLNALVPSSVSVPAASSAVVVEFSGISTSPPARKTVPPTMASSATIEAPASATNVPVVLVTACASVS